MPPFIAPPFGPVPKALLAGTPLLLIGTAVPGARFAILDVALASNVATYTVKLLEGNIPAVGALASVQGALGAVGGAITAAAIHSGNAGTGFAVNDTLSVTGGGGSGAVIKVATQSGGVPATYTVVQGGSGYTTTANVTLVVLTGTGTAGTADITANAINNFNVTAVALASVTIAGDGTGTLTLNLTGSNTSTTASGGFLVIPDANAGELLGSSPFTSIAAAMMSMPGFPSNSRDMTVTVLHPSAPASYSLQIQGALSLDSTWENIGTAITADGAQTILGVRYNLVRVVDTFSGGSSPSAIVKVLV